jgi:hypothetical protein
VIVVKVTGDNKFHGDGGINVKRLEVLQRDWCSTRRIATGIDDDPLAISDVNDYALTDTRTEN